MEFTVMIRFSSEQELQKLLHALGAARGALENVRSMSDYHDRQATIIEEFQDTLRDAPHHDV